MLVLLAYCEHLVRSTLEALSMVMPVITTDDPGCRDVTDRINVPLVPAQGASAVVQAMAGFIAAPGTSLRMSAAPRERVLACSITDHVKARILDVLRECLN